MYYLLDHMRKNLPDNEDENVIYVKDPRREAKVKVSGTIIHRKVLEWQHAKPENIPEIRKIFEEWTNRILNTDYTENEAQLKKDLAYWYHTSVQGTFFERGSSAITQAIFVALCDVKKNKLPKFIELLDCWALSMQAEDFEKEIFTPWFNKEKISLVMKYQYIENEGLQEKSLEKYREHIIKEAFNTLETEADEFVLDKAGKALILHASSDTKYLALLVAELKLEGNKKKRLVAAIKTLGEIGRIRRPYVREIDQKIDREIDEEIGKFLENDDEDVRRAAENA